MATLPYATDSRPVGEPVPPGERINAVAALRGFALFGVLAVNLVTDFRISIFQQFLPSNRLAKALDALAETFVSFALESKAFSLFSILFGVGLTMQLERLSRGNHPYYLLTRRLIALLGFGLLHLFLIWNGDILTEYALAGLLILPAIGRPTLVAHRCVGWLVLALRSAADIASHLMARLRDADQPCRDGGSCLFNRHVSRGLAV